MKVVNSMNLFSPQGAGILSGEQDVGSESGRGFGPNSVSDDEPGSAQTHQRVHHSSHAVVSGKYFTQHKLLHTCYVPVTHCNLAEGLNIQRSFSQMAFFKFSYLCQC